MALQHHLKRRWTTAKLRAESPLTKTFSADVRFGQKLSCGKHVSLSKWLLSQPTSRSDEQGLAMSSALPVELAEPHALVLEVL